MNILKYIIIWISSFFPREKLFIINDGVSQTSLYQAGRFLEKSLNVSVVYATSNKTLFSKDRVLHKEYNAEKTISYLTGLNSKERILLVTNKRIGCWRLCLYHFNLEWTHLYGQASFESPVCVVSTVFSDSLRVEHDLEIDAMHELGHTFGLAHCEDQTCYMSEGDAFTSYHYCNKCSKQLKRLRNETKRINW